MEKKVRTVDRSDLPVFPDYQVLETKESVDLLTFIRKEHKSVWYVIGVRLRNEYDENISPDRKVTIKYQLFKQFIAEAYKTILFYIIDPEMAVIDSLKGHPILMVDENQESEEERLLIKV